MSTRSPTEFSLREALLQGLCADGGLFVPSALPQLDLSALRGASLPAVAIAALSPYLDSTLSASEIRSIIEEAFSFEVPLHPLDGKSSILELFHGPTLAFKDFGARFLAAAMRRLDQTPSTILVATSGDTGGAVANAFYSATEGRVRVVVLFPEGRVSAAQQRQITTLGGNIRAVAIQGTFDDCQRLAKEAFRDSELRATLNLASANSISLGRLLPQTVYYLHGYLQLGTPQEIVFAVPSGNLGNLTAGCLMRTMAIPQARFTVATNANDVYPRFLESGTLVPQLSRETLANAMDVGDPSNAERLEWYSKAIGEPLSRFLSGVSFSDKQTLAAIQECDDRFGYVVDPHTAIGYLGLDHHRKTTGFGGTGVILATAHPGKFTDSVSKALGREIDLPPALAARLKLEERFDVLGTEYAELRELLAEAK